VDRATGARIDRRIERLITKKGEKGSRGGRDANDSRRMTEGRVWKNGALGGERGRESAGASGVSGGPGQGSQRPAGSACKVMISSL